MNTYSHHRYLQSHPKIKIKKIKQSLALGHITIIYREKSKSYVICVIYVW